MMKRPLILLITLLVFLLSQDAEAQCVMCKAVAEDAADGSGIGRGLNKAILYLMAVPYAILTTLYFMFFKKKRTFQKSEPKSS